VAGRKALAQPGTGRVKVTLNQKVLVHLLPLARYADRRDAPVSITQQGIADFLRVRRSHVTLALQSLTNHGLVRYDTMRIAGSTRRKKAYFLTPHGYERARETEAFLAAMPVVLDGDGTEIAFGRAPERFGEGYTVRDLLAYLRSDGVLDPPPATG
jgi:DNA-binding MarR family transcriptional regulator